MTVLPNLPLLSTERLALRRLDTADDLALQVLRSDKRVNAFLHHRPPAISLSEAQETIQKLNKRIDDRELMYWAITENGKNLLIGTICIWNLNTVQASLEIGYELHPDFQQRGLMQEALTAVTTWCYAHLPIKTITAFCNPQNTASIQLLQKNNFIPDLQRRFAARETDSGLSIYYRTIQ